MKQLFIFLFAILSLLKAYPQQSLSGKIVDSQTGKPVSYAQVIVKGTELGTSTNKSGQFKISNITFPLTLVISDIRYKTQQIRVSSGPIQVSIDPKDYALDQVIIRPDDVERVLKEPIFSVIDYGFYDDLVVLAVMKNRKTKAYIRVQEGNGKLLWERRLPFVPEQFFEDCLGNLHIFSADSSYQLYYDYVSLHLLYPKSKKYVLSQLWPCKAYWRDKAYFQFASRGGLIQNYISSKNGDQRRLYQLADSTKIAYLNAEYDLHYFLKLKSQNREPFAKLTVNQINDRLSHFQDMIGKDWLDQQILEPVHAPIHLLKNRIGIFDFKESRVFTFDENDSLLANKQIGFHKEEGWTNEVLMDPSTRFMYAPTEVKGQYSFMRIDPESLRIKRFIPLKDHDFVKNYQIRNGYIYFIDRNLKMRDSQTFSLYRIRI